MGNQQSVDPNVIPDYLNEYLNMDLSIDENRRKCLLAIRESRHFLALQVLLSKSTQDQINEIKLDFIIPDSGKQTDADYVKCMISKYTRSLESKEIEVTLNRSVCNVYLLSYLLDEPCFQAAINSQLEQMYSRAACYGKGTLKLLIDRYGYQFSDQIKKAAMERRNKESMKLILSYSDVASDSNSFTLEELLYVDNYELVVNRLETSTSEEISKALISILEITERSHKLTMEATSSNKPGVAFTINNTVVVKGDINPYNRSIIDLLLPKADLSYNNYRIVELITNRGLYWYLEIILPSIDFNLCWDKLFIGSCYYYNCRKCFDMILADPRSHNMIINDIALETTDITRVKDIVNRYGITEQQKSKLKIFWGDAYEKMINFI